MDMDTNFQCIFASVREQWELLSDRMQINDMENDMNAVWLLQRIRIAESIELNK